MKGEKKKEKILKIRKKIICQTEKIMNLENDCVLFYFITRFDSTVVASYNLAFLFEIREAHSILGKVSRLKKKKKKREAKRTGRRCESYKERKKMRK